MIYVQVPVYFLAMNEMNEWNGKERMLALNFSLTRSNMPVPFLAALFLYVLYFLGIQINNKLIYF
jgi:hypothetical protein